MNNDFIFCKMPEVTGKTAPLFLYGEDGASILADRVYFSSVSYDRRRSSDFFHLLIRHTGTAGNIKMEKCFSVSFPPFQNRRPGKPRLGAFQNQHLKKVSIIMMGTAPFFIMISL